MTENQQKEHETKKKKKTNRNPPIFPEKFPFLVGNDALNQDLRIWLHPGTYCSSTGKTTALLDGENPPPPT